MLRQAACGRLFCFGEGGQIDWLKREPLISIKKEPGTRIASRLSLVVPLTGLEPVRILLRGILSPLCLPIPPQRQVDGFT